MSSSPLIRLERLRRHRSIGSMWGLVIALTFPAVVALVMHRVATTQLGTFTDSGWGNDLADRFGVQVGTFGVLITTAAALMSISVVIPLEFGGYIAGAREDGRFTDLRLTRIGETGFISSGLYLAVTRLFVMMCAMLPIIVAPTLHSPISPRVLLSAASALALGGVVVCALTLLSSVSAATNRSGIARSFVASFALVWLPLGTVVAAQLVGYLRNPGAGTTTISSINTWNVFGTFSPASLPLWASAGSDATTTASTQLVLTVTIAVVVSGAAIAWAHRQVQRLY